MLTTWKTLILMNMLLIVATEDNANSGSDLVESTTALSNRQNIKKSDIWIRKMKTLFRIIDFDGDGVICRADFDHMAKGFAHLEKFNSAQRKIFRQSGRDLFWLYTKAARAEAKGTTAGRTEPAKTTAGRTEPAKTTAGRTEPAKTTAGRTEPAKTTAGRTEPAKTTAGRTEPAKTTAGRTKAAGIEAAAKEAGRIEDDDDDDDNDDDDDDDDEDDDVLMTEDLLIESISKYIDDPSFKKTHDDALLSLFTLMKVSQEGYFNYEEYRRVYASLGFVNTDYTAAAFSAVDADQDGRVSSAEYLNATNYYMYSDDENSTAMFGLLV